MQFNSGTNSIVDEIDSLCDSDSNSYPIADKTRRVNYSLEILVGDILAADGTWDWDDTNYTDLPRGTFDLQHGIGSYTFTSDYLEIKSIKVKDDGGDWNRVSPIDESFLPGDNQTVEEYFESDGLPRYYDKLGDTITLYPAPDSDDVTLSEGGKIEFSRTADLFTTSDTTKEPGLPKPYHVVLAYMAAIPYCMKYKPERVAAYQQFVNEQRNNLLDFFGIRNKDLDSSMKPRGIKHR